MAVGNLENQERGISQRRTIPLTEIVDVYTEMFNLLEDYAPAWYTEELHTRAAAGLDALRGMSNSTVNPSGERAES